MKVGKKIINTVEPYCNEIRFNGKHYICYLKDGKSVITVSSTPRGNFFIRQIYNDFRRAGVEVRELLGVS